MYQKWTMYEFMCCNMYHSTVRDFRLAYYLPFRVRSCALQSECQIILITVSFIEFRVYFHPYYIMTLGNNCLCLVVVLL
jgi:hypothetical protein